MSLSLILPRWYDLHAHFRQDDLIAPLVQAHLSMGCCGILAMPNTSPPVAKIFDTDSLPYTSLESYRRQLQDAANGLLETIIVPLYLTAQTTPQMIAAGAHTGLLKACKYYPPHGTTGAMHGAPLELFIQNGVLRAMEEHNVILCVHGEAHDLAAEKYFDEKTNAEDLFYREMLPPVLDAFPRLKIVAEHITTRTAAEFVARGPDTLAASITPQHLLYTVGHLLKGLRYHLYCLPLPKFSDDRAALQEAVLDKSNQKFFAGTDSAPHAQKTTDCGCAAGCFTGGIAPQLYAQAFEEAGCNLEDPAQQKIFAAFLCENGPTFYGLPVAQKTFQLRKEPQNIHTLKIGSHEIVPLPLGMRADMNAQRATLPWQVHL
ncbi:MAG: hypothetical protein L6Q57_06625 [Alphaproteobacteria bacterium]|nr:hypothetical protein [Alphaproteobacteria bacterium]